MRAYAGKERRVGGGRGWEGRVGGGGRDGGRGTCMLKTCNEERRVHEVDMNGVSCAHSMDT